MAGEEVEMTADAVLTADMDVLLVTSGTCFGAGTQSCALSDRGFELPIDMPLFHSTGDGKGSRKAGQKAGQSC
jgi:hypothetical protein